MSTNSTADPRPITSQLRWSTLCVRRMSSTPGTSSIDAASITTGDANRDAHLRGTDFLDVEQFPTITFVSKRIEGSRDEFTLVGDLSLHGITREISLDVTFNGEGTNPYGKTVAGFTAETKLNRKDWGLNWNVALEAGGVLVSDQIKVAIEIQAVRG